MNYRKSFRLQFLRFTDQSVGRSFPISVLYARGVSDHRRRCLYHAERPLRHLAHYRPSEHPRDSAGECRRTVCLGHAPSAGLEDRGRQFHPLLCQLMAYRPRPPLCPQRLPFATYAVGDEDSREEPYHAQHCRNAASARLSHQLSVWWRHQFHQHAFLPHLYRLGAHRQYG